MPFTTDAYIAASSEVFGLESDTMEVALPDGSKARLRAFVRRDGPLRRVIIPPYTAYTPVREENGRATTAQVPLLMTRLAGRFHAAEIHLEPGAVLGDARLPDGWQVRNLVTMRMKLAPIDALLTVCTGNVRRMWNKHNAFYACVEDASAASKAAHYSASSYERHNRKPPATHIQLTRLIQKLVDAGTARIFTAVKDGRDEGVLVALLRDKEVYYWVVGSTPGPAMTVLTLYTMDRLYREGFEMLDFLGANTPGIAEFKGRFGAQRVPYVRLSYSGPLWRTIQRVRTRLSPGG